MSRSKRIAVSSLLLFGLLAVAASVRAQDPQEPPPTQEPPPPTPDSDPNAKPKPAARGVPGLDDNDTDQNQNTQQWQPDTAPPTGLENPSLGTPELRHSYIVPGLEYGSTIQSQPLGPQVKQGWYANQYVGADLSLLASGTHNTLGFNYSGGGFFTTSDQQNNGYYQILSFADSINFSRAQIQFFDNFSYIPESSFGFFGNTSVALPGVGGTLSPTIPGLGAAIVPNQSIYSAVGPRYSNGAAVQATYLISRRSSITVAGSYGLLHFTEPGNVDNNMILGSAGYNFQINRTDAIGVLYRFAAYHFNDEPQALGSHVANFVYTKKVTQKVAFSAYGGPMFMFFRVPVGTQKRQDSGNGGASVTYATPHGSIGATYFYGLTGGAGVLVGSLTSQVSGTLTHQLGRVWSANINFGYAQNKAVGGPIGGVQLGTFDDWFAGGGVSRPIGRYMSFAANYSARIESANTACPGGGTGCNNFTQNYITVSLQWHARPFVLP
jgi:hypothetical protein